MTSTAAQIQRPKVVSHAEWLAARQEHFAHEKEFTHLRDKLSRQRRELPWEKVEEEYRFEGPNGTQTLAELFEKRSQLIIYHFMLAPGWKEGCKSCSLVADHFDGFAVHLANRDITLAVVSRAPLSEIEAFKKRMGWRFKWVSSFGSSFNYDYQVSFTKEDVARGEVAYNYGKLYSGTPQFPSAELPGLSVFTKDPGGEVFHTYSTYSRGLDMLMGVYNFLDVTPKGRDEGGLPYGMAWVQHHDRYEDVYFADPGEAAACCASDSA